MGRELFGTPEEPTPLTSEVSYLPWPLWHYPSANAPRQILARKTKPLELSANGSAGPARELHIKLTDKEKGRLQEKIKQAKSLQEIMALEKELNEGRLPSGLGQDAMQE